MGHPQWLREEQSALIPWEKSAEGIVGGATQTPEEVCMDARGTRPVDRKSRRRKLSAETDCDGCYAFL